MGSLFLATSSYQPEASANEITNLCKLLEYLATEASKHPDLLVLAHHFRSLELVVENDGLAAPEQVEHLYKDFTTDWQHGAANWRVYLEGRPLIFAWKSPYDGVIQDQLVVLPKDFDPKISYPLFFELHAISPHDSPKMVMTYAAMSRGIGNAAQRREGVYVYPWNRGLTEYHGVGLIGLQECLESVDALLNTDSKRQYLFGFSMGGGGT